MFKLGKLTDYGTVVMAALAAEPAALRNAQALAASTHLSVPTVSKLLRQLARAGLLESARGAHGGYRLAREPARITVADVVAALEGPIALTQCSIHSGDCAIEPHCAVRANWRLIDTAIRQALESVTLEHMATALKSARARSREASPLNFVRNLRTHLPARQ
jgi:FeS assembly SUF system regulator